MGRPRRWTLIHKRRRPQLALFEDALDRQVLRQVGPVYQFRHAELQDHLAAQGAPTLSR